MPRTQAHKQWAQRMTAEGKCAHHGVMQPCTQCQNARRRHAATYYQRHKAVILQKKRERDQQRRQFEWARRSPGEGCSDDIPNHPVTGRS